MADWLKGQRLQKQYPRPPEGEDEEQVPRLPERLEQALSSAFNDFPDDDSRLLLLYMSMFPDGYKFYKDRLMLKWLHQGLTKFEKDRLILKWIHEGRTYNNLFYYSHSSDAMSKAEMMFSLLVDRNVVKGTVV